MAPNHLAAADFAGSVSSQLSQYKQQFGGGGRGAEYKKIPDILDQLEAALDSAISTDEAHAGGFWSEMKMFMRDGFNYWSEKKRFDNDVNDLVSTARSLMAEIRSLVEAEAEPKIPVPDDVMDIATRWDQVANATQTVSGTIPKLKNIDNWSGTAYEQYQTMADVQIEATKEYGNLPGLLAQAFKDTADLNKAVLSVVHERLSGALANSQMCYAAPDGRFYVNTANVSSALQTCATNLPDALDAGEAAAEAMAEAIADSRSATVVIQSGWPSGTAQAGQQAGDTAAQHVPTPVVVDDPVGSQPGTPAEGVDR